MPVGLEHIELVGERVRLRPIKESDAADAYRLLVDDAVLSNLVWDGPTSEAEIAEAYDRLEGELKSGESYSIAIERVDASGLLGCINPRFPRHPRQAEIGYWLGVPYWNQGYMTEAVRLVCHLSFKHLDAARAYATVFTSNVASRKVLEKNGFSVDGTLRSHVFKRGEWRDEWFLSLLRSEWEVREERYTPRHENIVFTRGE
ncbi:MAG: GNAT family N-acetyltransferase [Dehalococcoidales bacterium]|nr:MAG: GNAT family N-acetyltransferase [Dehalococcoidales bacterium]